MQTLHDKHSPQTCLTAVTKSLYYRKFFWTRRRWIRHFSMLKSNFIKAVSFKKINLSLWNIHESIRLFLKSKQYYCCQLNEVLYILMNQNLLLRNDFFLQLVFFLKGGEKWNLHVSFILCCIRYPVSCYYSKDATQLKQSGIFVSTGRKVRTKTRCQLPEEITANANHIYIV